MSKTAIFTFTGEKMCFAHALLNVLDLHEKGEEATIIVEGASVKLIKVLEEEENPIYLKAKELGLIGMICKACSNMMGVLEFNESVGIPVGGNMKGHPAFSDYMEKGYSIVTI